MVIAKFDPDGVRVPPSVDDSRYVEVGPTVPGMAGIWANIHAVDAAAFDARLDALAATVCRNDPRTTMQRRSDAVGALAAGTDRLMCACGLEGCPAVGGGAPPVVIHLLAEQATVGATGDAPGYLPGFGIQPAESVRNLARSAKLKPLIAPVGQDSPGYRPPVALAEFIRWRDLTCRWPGCDAPVCDTDHTVPYPFGPTHPSNVKLYCRVHHLVKTFYCGPGGWTENQYADGTVTFTAPTGHRYTTYPGGAQLYPMLSTPTGVLGCTDQPPQATGNRGLAAPTRRQSRDQDRRDRTERERCQRAESNRVRNVDRSGSGPSLSEDSPPF